MKPEQSDAIRQTTGLSWYRWAPRRTDGETPFPAGQGLALKGITGDLGLLGNRSIVTMGLGAVGGTAFLLSARLGIGTLIGVDPDSYGAHSWLTQPALATDTGRPKARVLGEAAHTINPVIRVETAVGVAQDLPLGILKRAGLFLAAGDNPELVVWAGTMAAALGKRLIQAAVHPETWTALVRTYDLADPDSPCPACGLSGREWGRLSSRHGCDPETAAAQGTEPTRTLPTTCGTAAHLAVTEALKWLLGLERQALPGEELAYCLLSHRLWRTRLTRNPRCRCPHRRWRLIDLQENPEQISVAQLIERFGTASLLDAGNGVKSPGVQIRSEVPWISFTLCSACGTKSPPVYRFARMGSVVGQCSCGQTLLASPLGMRSVVPPGDLRACLNRPLSELGMEPGAALGISLDEDWTYFLFPEAPGKNEVSHDP